MSSTPAAPATTRPATTASRSAGPADTHRRACRHASPGLPTRIAGPPFIAVADAAASGATNDAPRPSQFERTSSLTWPPGTGPPPSSARPCARTRDRTDIARHKRGATTRFGSGEVSPRAHPPSQTDKHPRVPSGIRRSALSPQADVPGPNSTTPPTPHFFNSPPPSAAAKCPQNRPPPIRPRRPADRPPAQPQRRTHPRVSLRPQRHLTPAPSRAPLRQAFDGPEQGQPTKRATHPCAALRDNPEPRRHPHQPTRSPHTSHQPISGPAPNPPRSLKEAPF